jgi:hypothetical protein
MLAVGSYLSYSVVAYYAIAVMAYGWPHGWGPALFFWLGNAPWLAGGGLMAVAGWRSSS